MKPTRYLQGGKILRPPTAPPRPLPPPRPPPPPPPYPKGRSRFLKKQWKPMHFQTTQATYMRGFLPLKSLRIPNLTSTTPENLLVYWLYFWITGTLLLSFYEEDERERTHRTLEHKEDKAQQSDMQEEHPPSKQSKASEIPPPTRQNIHNPSSKSTTTQTSGTTAYPRRRRDFARDTVDWLSISGMPIGATLHGINVIRHRTTTKNPGQDSGGGLPNTSFMDIIRGWEPISGVL